jgi:hypothetical protein
VSYQIRKEKYPTAGWWFSLGTPVSCTNKTDCHDITEILLKMALTTITLTLQTSNFIAHKMTTNYLLFYWLEVQITIFTNLINYLSQPFEVCGNLL